MNCKKCEGGREKKCFACKLIALNLNKHNWVAYLFQIKIKDVNRNIPQHYGPYSDCMEAILCRE